LHAVDHAVSHRPDRSETILFFEPINQRIRCRLVIGGGDAATVLLILGRVVERQIRPAQANAVNPSIKPSFGRFACLVQRELDARRSAIDCQNACLNWFQSVFLFSVVAQKAQLGAAGRG
jgi:hypothetical protein